MSIFKDSFADFVKKQLSQREKIIASGTGRKEETLEFNFNESRSANFFTYQQKQCVIRLSSGVNIMDKSIIEEGEEGTGKTLAERYVLEGGIKDGDTNRGGISSTTARPFTSNALSGAYGDSFLRANAEDGFGIVPMPGITSVNVRTKSAYGSLREAKVEFVCHNRRQLAILELLYMRPGYTLLLEWQWSPYIDNDGNAQYNNIKKVDFFDSNKSISSIEKEIESFKEDTGGNYDALVGYCKNFTYKLRPDGGFECTTEIIAKGEVIESILGKEETAKFRSGNKDVLTSRPSLELLFSDLVQLNNIVASEAGGKIQIKEDTVLGDAATYHQEIGPKLGIDKDWNPYYVEGGESLFPYVLTGGPLAYTDWNTNTNPDVEGVEIDDDELSDEQGFWSFFGWGDRFRVSTTWIRWDALCYFINNEVIPKNEKGEPIAAFQTAYTTPPNKNGQVRLKSLLYSSKFLATKHVTSRLPKLKVLKKENLDDPKATSIGEKDMQYYGLTDISVNNEICMLPHNLDAYRLINQDLAAGQEKLKKGILKEGFHQDLNQYLVDKVPFSFIEGIDTQFATNVVGTRGKVNRISNIYFGVEFLYKAFREMYYDSDGNAVKDFSLFKYIKKIWEEVNQCTAGAHDFDIQTDNIGGGSILRIIDRQVDNSFEKIEDPHILKVQSLDSVVRDITYNTTIPSSLSTTIAVAAQSPDSVNDLDKVSFAALNKGIKDRFAVGSTKPTKPSSEQRAEWNRNFELNLTRITDACYISDLKGEEGSGGTLRKLLYREYQTNRNYILFEEHAGIIPDKTNEYRGALTNLISALNYFLNHYGSTNEALGFYRGQPATDSVSPLSAVIPLKFNAVLDGISGMVIGNVFKIPKDRLPIAYDGDDIHFIVMSEAQDITAGQDWTTTISGHLVLLGDASSEEYRKSKHHKSWENVDVGISDSVFEDLRRLGETNIQSPTYIGSNLAGTIPNSQIGPPLAGTLEVSGDNVFGENRGVYADNEDNRRLNRVGKPRIHKGVDLIADDNSPLYAVADAKVSFAGGGYTGWGGAIKLRFKKDPTGADEFKSTSPKYALYAHCNKWALADGTPLVQGMEVKKGDLIGLSGGGSSNSKFYKGNSEGSHLHLEFYLQDGDTQIDPMPWLKGLVAQRPETGDYYAGKTTPRITGTDAKVQETIRQYVKNKGATYHTGVVYRAYDAKSAIQLAINDAVLTMLDELNISRNYRGPIPGMGFGAYVRAGNRSTNPAIWTPSKPENYNVRSEYKTTENKVKYYSNGVFITMVLGDENDIGILENWRVLDTKYVYINKRNKYPVVVSGGYPLGTLTNLTGRVAKAAHQKNPPYKKEDLVRIIDGKIVK